MRIGQLAETSGLTTKTIRYYEAEGLLPPPQRTRSGYRAYRNGDVERLQFIKKAQRLGLSLREVRGIIALHERREPTCVHVRSLLEEKLTQVEAALRDLRVFRRELVRLRRAAASTQDCRPGGGIICSIIERATTQNKRHGVTYREPLRKLVGLRARPPR